MDTHPVTLIACTEGLGVKGELFPPGIEHIGRDRFPLTTSSCVHNVVPIGFADSGTRILITHFTALSKPSLAQKSLDLMIFLFVCSFQVLQPCFIAESSPLLTRYLNTL